MKGWLLLDPVRPESAVRAVQHDDLGRPSGGGVGGRPAWLLSSWVGPNAAGPDFTFSCHCYSTASSGWTDAGMLDR